MSVYVGFLILIIVEGVFSSDGSCVTEPSCPKNEHYTQNNTQCIRTCANRAVPISYDCKPVTGCVCDEGLVRKKADGTGKCISESKCRNKCKGPHQVYTDYLNPCPVTCDYPYPRPCAYDPSFNKGGCECAPGYVLNEANGKCVRPEKCPENKRKCKPHQVYTVCPNPCPPSCENPEPTGPCIYMCLAEGCQCAEGYILDVNDPKEGKCIKPEDCPCKK